MAFSIKWYNSDLISELWVQSSHRSVASYEPLSSGQKYNADPRVIICSCALCDKGELRTNLSKTCLSPLLEKTVHLWP